MDRDKIDKIKSAVKMNFEDSPQAYREFEDRYGFFRDLNETLINRMHPAAGARVLDIGCGTGVSVKQIHDAIPDSEVWGLDNSPAMLDAARALYGDNERLHFIEGDGARPDEFVEGPFDAVVYSASIFLMPDYAESLRAVRGLLKEGGVVGLTFMDGLYDPFGKHVLALADRDAQEGVSLRKPVNLADFHEAFRRIFVRERTFQDDMRLPEQLLRDFYSVPAMSAGLFPSIDYRERVKKVNRLFDHLPKTQYVFRWITMVGER